MRLIPLAILCVLAGATYWFGATVYTDKIEQDIATRTNEAIASFKPAVALDVDGRDVTLTGRVRDESSREEALQTVDSVFGVRATRDSLGIMDAYNIHGKYRKGGQFVVDGTVDDLSVDDVVRETVSPIPTTGTLDTGARPLLKGGDKVALAAGAVSMLNYGEMWVDEERVKVTGEAEDEAKKAHIENFLNSQRDIVHPLKLVSQITVAPLPAQCQALANSPRVVETILFDVDSDVVGETYTAQLQNIVDLVHTCANDKSGNVIVEAHADHDGSEDYNYNLSQRRADQVAKQLLSQGLAVKHIASFAFGETRPVASNETRNDKSYNRRVEVRFITDSDVSTPVNQPIISTQNAE